MKTLWSVMVAFTMLTAEFAVAALLMIAPWRAIRGAGRGRRHVF